MPDLADGETAHVQGSAAKPYELKNVGGVYSCSCPAWRNQSVAIEARTCKHLRAFRGDAAEEERVAAARARAGGPDEPAPSTPRGRAQKKPGAPPLLLAESWEPHQDLTGWWMSEKLDGVRAYWDGARFVSRLGNPYHAPDWFVAGLPDVPLDGELWIARKAFQRTVSVVRRQDRSEHWKELTFVVFDAPALDRPFEERLAFVGERLAEGKAPHARSHAHERCTGLAHLQGELARLDALGAEGLMMRRPGSRYEIGRSATLLKVKSFRDAEARVIAHQEGAGRHQGRLGALVVELPDGTRFAVGTGFTDAERADPPPVGRWITFRYQELSDGGVPRFPSYVGLREEPATAPARRFELPGTGKRWSVAIHGADVVVRSSRGGGAELEKTKSFADPEGARRHAERLIAEKLAEGWREA